MSQPIISTTNLSIRNGLISSFTAAVISGCGGLLILLLDVVIAARYGTGSVVDAFQLAISFPMLTINILAGGTLLAVLVPVFTQLNVSNHIKEAGLILTKVKKMLSVFLFFVCAIWGLTYPYVVKNFTHGLSSNTIELSIRIAWLVLPILFFSGLAGINAAELNSRKRFIFISTMPAFMPTSALLFILFFETWINIYAAAVGILVGSIAQWIISQVLVRKSIFQTNSLKSLKPILADIKRNYFMTAISAAMIGGVYWTNTLMASTLKQGDIAIYSYASRPVILVLAFITTITSNVALPTFSHLVAIENWLELKRITTFWVSITSLASISLASIWYWYVIEIVDFIYQHGTFKIEDTLNVASLQRIYLLQTPFYLAAMIGMRLLNSTKNNNILFIISMVCFTTNLLANICLTRRFGLIGIAWSANISFILWAISIFIYIIHFLNKKIAD